MAELFTISYFIKCKLVVKKDSSVELAMKVFAYEELHSVVYALNLLY